MDIKTKELKNFFSISSAIKPNKFLPITENIKIEVVEGNCKITKANVNAFVVYNFDIESKDCEYLINEQILRTFVMQSADELIVIDANKISDSVSRIKTDFFNTKEFPSTPEETSNSVEFNETITKSLLVARAFCIEEESLFSCVHIKNNTIFSSARFVIYTKNIDTEIPNIVLSKECITALNGESYRYSSAGNYNFFTSEKLTFCFIKSEFLTPDFDKIIDNKGLEKYFSFNKSCLVNFCKLVGSISSDPTPMAKMLPGKLMYDNKYNKKVEVDFVTNGNEEPEEFYFNTIYIQQYISQLPYDTLNFSKCTGGHYKIWTNEDENYIGMISKFVG